MCIRDRFKNYLTNRVQFTCVNNISSTVAEITCGVPQGSVLGPLMFLIYINDIAIAVPNEKVRLFADDTNLFLARNTALSVANAANNTMFKLNNWFLANKLSLNTDKTFYMIFPPDTSNFIKVYVNNVEIQRLPIVGILELLLIVMDMSSCRPMGASVARLVILISGARSRSWN